VLEKLSDRQADRRHLKQVVQNIGLLTKLLKFSVCAKERHSTWTVYSYSCGSDEPKYIYEEMKIRLNSGMFATIQFRIVYLPASYIKT
jgi:hypothetical protein